MRHWPVLVSPAAALGLALFALPAAEAHALDPFADGSALLQNPDLSSGVAIGIADMNADGFDDIVRLGDTQILEVEYQNPDGSGFQGVVYGPVPGSAWGLTIGDVDRNGMPDIFAGGAYDGLKLLLADETGLDWDLTFMPTPPGDIFVQ